jgi:hypothetical protein
MVIEPYNIVQVSQQPQTYAHALQALTATSLLENIARAGIFQIIQ